MESDYYSSWEWQSIDLMSGGCSDIIVRDDNGNTREMCSCDYWWLSKQDKEQYTTFRFA